MPRAKSSTARKKRHKKILNLAKGYRGGRSKWFKKANESVSRSLQYAYRDRKVRKRSFRALWVQRINAAARLNGMSYSRFIHGLNKAQIEIDRKTLADIAINDPDAFTELARRAEQAL